MPRSLDEDPLTMAMAPPPDETPTQRAQREAAEAEAQRISDEIDEQIRKERENKKRKKRPVKVLLLGQSESGKTATLKNFQLTYSKREFAAERASWRAVIQLNLVRNVNAVLQALTAEMAEKGKGAAAPPPADDEDWDEDDEDDILEEIPAVDPSSVAQGRRASISGSSSPKASGSSSMKAVARHVSTPSGSIVMPTPSSTSSSVSAPSSRSAPSTRAASRKKSKPSANATPGPKLKFTEAHRVLRLRLSPLARVQRDLERRLGAGSMEPDSTNVTTAAPFETAFTNGNGNGNANGHGNGHAGGGYSSGGEGGSGRRALQEFSVNSNNGWKSALEKLKSGVPGMSRGRPESAGSGSSGGRTKKDIDEEVTEVISGCREDMRSLWEDPVVREMLSRRKARIEDSPGFFLNDVERIATRTYQPTDDDVIRARLRTLGVQEYRFVFDSGRTVGQTWHMFDVGGTRSSRAAWYPYFDDVDAIIFLAPISCFDEKLAEDRRVNRLEDSYLLWRSVCASKLLTRTQLILFLNKCDLLQAKLMRGVRIRDHVPSFGERRNDLGTATRYFQQHFKEISKQFSPAPRPFYVHLTSVIDTKSTAATLGAVEESILRDHLRRADLIV